MRPSDICRPCGLATFGGSARKRSRRPRRRLVRARNDLRCRGRTRRVNVSRLERRLEALRSNLRAGFSLFRGPSIGLRAPFSLFRSPLESLRTPLPILKSPKNSLREALSIFPWTTWTAGSPFSTLADAPLDAVTRSVASGTPCIEPGAEGSTRPSPSIRSTRSG